MKASELRIGNLLQWYEPETGFTTCLVSVVNSDDTIRVNLKGNIIGCYHVTYQSIRPIPITEEWFDKLEDMGWEFVGFGTRIIYQHTIFKAIKVELGGYDQVAIYFNNELLCFKEYLHELQNLYFSLTGEELNF